MAAGAPLQGVANALADQLVDARRHHAQCVASDWPQGLPSAAEAYAVQDAVAAALGWFADTGGGVPLHWKSGGASRQTTLTHAPLPPAGVRAGPADLRSFALHTRGVEAEIALRLGVDVDAARAASLSSSAETATQLIDAMTVSIEIVDSRWREGAQAPALLRLADQQSHAALVLGRWLPYAGRDWATQRCEVQIGSQPPSTHIGSYALGDPAWLLPLWLRHATRHGGVVAAGTVVTTGTWCGLLPARAGDLVQVDFAGVGTATVQL